MDRYLGFDLCSGVNRFFSRFAKLQNIDKRDSQFSIEKIDFYYPFTIALYHIKKTKFNYYHLLFEQNFSFQVFFFQIFKDILKRAR